MTWPYLFYNKKLNSNAVRQFLEFLGHFATKSFLRVSHFLNATSLSKNFLTSVWFSRFLDEGKSCKSLLPDVSNLPRTSRLS